DNKDSGLSMVQPFSFPHRGGNRSILRNVTYIVGHSSLHNKTFHQPLQLDIRGCLRLPRVGENPKPDNPRISDVLVDHQARRVSWLCHFRARTILSPSTRISPFGYPPMSVIDCNSSRQSVLSPHPFL